MFLLFVEMFSFDVFTSGIDVETDFAEISKSFSNSFWEILSKLEVISIEDSVLLFMSPNDLTGFEQNYINKYHEVNDKESTEK